MSDTIARSRLSTIDTTTLIAQYELAISSHAGRNTNCSPRQNRISYIVDILTDRADCGDPIALVWFAS